MSEGYDRRNFIRRTSMGAAAVGALAVGGPLLGETAKADATTGKPAETSGPILDGSDVIAHVVDARTGLISILVGTREINYVNRDLAQQLIRATK